MALAGISTSSERIPTSLQAVTLLRTYTWEAGSPPHQNDGQSRPNAVLLLQPQDALFLFPADFRGNGLAVYDSCAHLVLDSTVLDRL
ncbi:MAG: hypothetical protein WDM77_08715 [Steroidobacteraceae bacterium]